MEKPKAEKFESKIIKSERINDSLRHLKLSVPDNFRFIPGQFVSFIIEKDSKKIRRPYSIASSDNQKGSINIIYKLIPDGLITPILDNMKKGDKLLLNGPMGEFFIKDKNKNIIFVSTGTGIAPFMSMIPSLLKSGFKHNLTLFAGYKNEDSILYEREFNKLGRKYSNFKYYRILSQPSKNYKGDIGRVQQLIEKRIDKKKVGDSDVYICGLTEMINSVRILLVKKGIEMKNIYSERYD